MRLVHPNTPVAENVTRIVVEGSAGRTEYVRLTVDPKTKDGSLFSLGAGAAVLRDYAALGCLVVAETGRRESAGPFARK